MSNEPWSLSAGEGTRRIRSRELSAVEWARSCAERVEELESGVGAWAYFDREKVLAQARCLDKKIAHGQTLGELCGVPIGIKDTFNTQDMPTSMGSPIWEGFRPGNDARVVFYLRQADGVIAGKTVTAEFAVHAPGKTVNPHAPGYSPGTSSSGSAAAVAAHMVPLALGTQSAGSIIRPASYCGVYGFKPSFGLVPRTGILKTTDTLDTVGVFARVPEDLNLLFEVIRVHGENFPVSHALLMDPACQNPGGPALEGRGRNLFTLGLGSRGEVCASNIRSRVSIWL